MKKPSIEIPKLGAQEMKHANAGARIAFAGHPMDDFMDRTFAALKQRRSRKSAFIKPVKKNATFTY
jgi:hypothetical protein